jgi:hypothetical protein
MSVEWTKYFQPRRQGFAIVIKRTKNRKEVQDNLDPDLVFDTMSSMMLYALIFPPVDESWETYVDRTLNLLLRGAAL